MLLPLLSLVMAAHQKSPAWTPERLFDESQKSTVSATFEPELVKWFGGDAALQKGADAKVQDLTVAWAIEVPTASKRVMVEIVEGSHPNESSFPSTTHFVRESKPMLAYSLKQVGTGKLFAGAFRLPEGAGFLWRYSIDGQPVGDPRQLEVYTMPKESKPDPAIPTGMLEPQPPMTSQIFGGTKHDWWIYTPAGFDPTKESNLAVFQDGQWSHGYAPVYFDHLIATHDLPQTVVVFVTPGTFRDGTSDRSREYDTLNDMYVRFLLEELLPPIEAKYKITQDPMRRCVAGLSSGGICAFTAAWQRPDKFGLVMSWIGSFTDIASGPALIEGGHNYPALIRKTPHKPIKVFLQDGANDLDNVHGNWPLSNKQMFAALEFAKYDVRASWGNGFHSDKHGRAIMADVLR
jgi:enterochelin esterase-like enzyme